MQHSGIILEYAQVGRIIEVRAIDPNDGLEVTYMVPVNTPDQELELIALRKLDWVRNRRELGHANAASGASTGSTPGGVRKDRRGGILV